jgi:hypothetical protein
MLRFFRLFCHFRRHARLFDFDYRPRHCSFAMILFSRRAAADAHAIHAAADVAAMPAMVRKRRASVMRRAAC